MRVIEPGDPLDPWTLDEGARAALIRETAREWTIAANEGMDANRILRGTYRPINVGRADGLDVVERAFEAGVRPDAIARQVVYRMAVEFQPARFGESITSLAYFRDRLCDVYSREALRMETPGRSIGEVDIAPTRGGGGRRYPSRDEQRAAATAATGAGAAAAADSLGLVE